MRQEGLGGWPAGRTSRTVLLKAATAGSWAPAPTRPGLGSRLCPGVRGSPPRVRGRRGGEGPGLCAQVFRVPQCACVRAPGAPPLLGHAADSRPAPLPPPPRLHRGWKRGWGARQCHPSHRDLPLLPGGSTVRQLVSRDSVQAWSSHGGGGGAQWGRRATRPPWDGRPGWSHPGLTPGLRVPAGHRTSVTVWAAVLWLSGRSHLLRQKRGWGSGTGRWQEDSLRPAVGALLSLGDL